MADGGDTATVRDEPVTVRRATPADRDDVWPLAREFATSFRPVRGAFDASFAAVLADPAMLLVVAEARELGIAGYLLADSHPTFLANGHVVWVEEVMVDERLRRSGVGRALMAAAERWSRSLGAAYVCLATRRAGAFYRALGYEESAAFFRKPGR